MKPFELIISVDKDGRSKLVIDGPGKKEVTQGQIITYLAGELEKYELNISMDSMTKKFMQEIQKQSKGIQVVKDIPPKFRKQ